MPAASKGWNGMLCGARVRAIESCLADLWRFSDTWDVHEIKRYQETEGTIPTVQLGDVWLVDVSPLEQGRRHAPDKREEYWVCVKGKEGETKFVVQDTD